MGGLRGRRVPTGCSVMMRRMIVVIRRMGVRIVEGFASKKWGAMGACLGMHGDGSYDEFMF